MREVKNMLKSKLFAIFLAATFVCLTPSLILAAEGDAAWQVENFGIFQTPAKWQTVKLEEVLDRLGNVLEKRLKEHPDLKPKTDAPASTGPGEMLADFINAKNMFNKMLIESNINCYQATIEANNSYYIANLYFYKEPHLMSESEAIYFGEKTPGKTRKEFAAMMTMLQSEVIKFSQATDWQRFDTNVKILPDGPVEQLTVKNAPAYGIGIRVITNMFGLNIPYYVKIYVFNLDGHRAYAVLGCIDSDRSFWNKTLKPVLTSLK